MAVYQTTYTDQPAIGYPGMVANDETSNRVSRTMEDAAGVGFGKAVFRGVGDHGITATPTAGTLIGITISHEVLAPTTAGLADLYGQYANVGVMVLGVIWVLAGANVSDGEQAYVTSAGAFTNSASGNVILPGWFFDTTASSGALVKLARR